MKSLREQFIDWLETKPADEEYDYCSNNGCAFALFLIDAGYSGQPNVACDGWSDSAGNQREMPDGIEEALVRVDYDLPNCGRTFGALRSRLEKHERVQAVVGNEIGEGV